MWRRTSSASRSRRPGPRAWSSALDFIPPNRVPAAYPFAEVTHQRLVVTALHVIKLGLGSEVPQLDALLDALSDALSIFTRSRFGPNHNR
jgi:hypothetical protein